MADNWLRKKKCRLCDFESVGTVALIRHYKNVHGIKV